MGYEELFIRNDGLLKLNSTSWPVIDAILCLSIDKHGEPKKNRRVSWIEIAAVQYGCVAGYLVLMILR